MIRILINNVSFNEGLKFFKKVIEYKFGLSPQAKNKCKSRKLVILVALRRSILLLTFF